MRREDSRGRPRRMLAVCLLVLCMAGCAGSREKIAKPSSAGETGSVSVGRIVITTDQPTQEEKPLLPDDTPLALEGASPEGANGAAGEHLISEAAGQILSPEEVEYLGTDTFFWQSEIDDATFARMYGKSYKEDCPLPREQLRYLQVLHYDLQGNIHVGELVSSSRISDVLLSIFRQLYDARYPIAKMLLVDEYGGDDEASSADNNTSCFNFRRVANSHSLSYHAQGLAININPLYNPYLISGTAGGDVVCTPIPGEPYLDRTLDHPYMIRPDDLCVKLFKDAGFTWGGDWKYTPDYMHFDCRGSSY